MNKASWISIIITVIKSLPEIIEAVEDLYTKLFPGEKKGAEKLALVKEMLTTVDTEVESKWPKIEKIIAFIVNIYNTSGWFKTTERTMKDEI